MIRDPFRMSEIMLRAERGRGGLLSMNSPVSAPFAGEVASLKVRPLS